jgi:hypothetical protein
MFYLLEETINRPFISDLQGMAPFYEEVCQDLNWKVDQAILAKMRSVNEEKLKELEETIEDADKNLGEMEVREANLKKSEYLCRIGDKVLFYILRYFTPFFSTFFRFCFELLFTLCCLLV